MKKISIFSIFLMMIILGVGNTRVSAQDDSFFDDNSSDNTSDVVKTIALTSITENTDSPIKIDGSGNLTVLTDKDYEKDIVLGGGKNAAFENNTTIKGNVTLSGGNLVLGDNVEIHGNVKVVGAIISKGNLNISGSVTASSLTVGNNLDISGPVNITSTQTIVLGNNSDLAGTLTSHAGLKIGANSEVKLFLSGDTVTIDGKDYKLGGKVLLAGPNTTVNLPFVPKQKNADGSTAKVTTAPISDAPATAIKANVNSNDNANGNEGDKNNQNVEGDNFMENIDNVLNTDDLNKYVSKVIEANTDVKNLNLSSDNIEMDYKVPASLFGFIPTSLPANVKVSKDKTVDVGFPWYSFLYSTQTDKDAIKESVSKTVESYGSVGSEGWATNMQASIVNNVLSSLKNLFSK